MLTTLTLLENLINALSQQLWSEFYNLYWKAILSFCSKQGLLPSDARDAYRRGKIKATISLNALQDQGAVFQDKTLKPQELLEKDWQYSLIESALERLYVAPEVDRTTVDVFVDYAVRGMSAVDVAQKYGLKQNAVYQIKNRIIKRLATEIDVMQKISDKFNKI